MSKHNSKFELVKQYYDSGLWNKQMVSNAIERWITKEEAEKIMKEKKGDK